MKYLRTALYVAVVMAAWAQPGYGQTVTTGTLTGLVQDAQGGVLPGVTVTAVHVPTGTTYEGVTQGDGRYSLLNVRVGGPYQVTAALSGFRNAVMGNLNVRLGEETDVPIKMQLATVTENVTVTAEVSPIFTGSKSGATESISDQVIQALPTINRSFQDVARTSPYFNQIANDNLQAALSVAGRNVRYNNIQIDGAVNNDIFSVASGGGSTGTPGGSTETQPISFDVIQELQLVVSPYDVRQGMFSGGGINAVTRSGTNQIRGSAFYVFRDANLVGDGIDKRPIGAAFADKQFGGTLGGPILKNTAFFLGNVDWGRKTTPAGYSASGTTGVAYGHTAEVQQIQDIAAAQYGYNPGGINEFNRTTDNNKVFFRADVNLGAHQLTARHNYVDGINDIGFIDLVTYKFPGAFYRQHSETNSTVGQLNSRFRNSVNELRATYQRIRDFRTTIQDFPAVRVRISGGARVDLGSESTSHRNVLDQDVIELHDDYTMIRGGHTYTFGTHNELFKFRNLFIANAFGNYEFSSIANFAAGNAQSYAHTFSLTNDPLEATRFNVYQFSLYAGDQWRVRPNFTLTYGLRWDKPVFPDTPSANPDVLTRYGYRTDIVPAPNSWSPRAGFNWDISGDGTKQQVRGGVGLFTGRNPYVYLSNQYGATGIEFKRLSQSFSTSNNLPFTADPANQSKTLLAGAPNEINLVDPDYQFPAIVRGNLAYDRDLPAGVVGMVEVLFSNTVKDVTYSNINLVQSSTRLDGRPVFAKVNTALYTDVLLLKNTDKGDNWMITGQLERRFRSGWFARGAYSYGRSRTVSDTTNSTARSTWANVYSPGDINNPPLATSNFDLRHRVVLSGSYNFDFKKASASLSMYYSGQTGRPYSYNFGSDINGDGVTTNDLMYYPRESEVTVTASSGTYQDLVNFIEGGDCTGLAPGSIVTRNSCRMPFTHNLDFRAAIDVPVGRWRPEFTIDVLNLLNAFDRTLGQVQYAGFNDLLVTQVSESGGKYTYTLNDVAKPGFARFSRDDLRSRWQAQLGLRLRF